MHNNIYFVIYLHEYRLAIIRIKRYYYTNNLLNVNNTRVMMVLNTLWITIGHIKILLSGWTDNIILCRIFYNIPTTRLTPGKEVRVTSAKWNFEDNDRVFFTVSIFTRTRPGPGIKDRFAAGGWISAAAAAIASLLCP